MQNVSGSARAEPLLCYPLVTYLEFHNVFDFGDKNRGAADFQRLLDLHHYIPVVFPYLAALFPLGAALPDVVQNLFLPLILHTDEQGFVLLIGIESGRLEPGRMNPVPDKQCRQLRVILLLYNYYHQFHDIILLPALGDDFNLFYIAPVYLTRKDFTTPR